MKNKLGVRRARSPHGGIDCSFGQVEGHYVPSPVGRGFGKLRNEEVTTRDYKLSFMQFLVLTLQTTLIIDLKIPCDPNDPEGPSIAVELKKTVYLPLYDLQGNIACLVDPKERIVAENYRYSAFGEETIFNDKGDELADSMTNNPWRYQGKRIDKEEGLIYFGYRYYSPDTGRWITPDPLGTVDSPNLYAYARNNPLHFKDYFGLASEAHPKCVCGYCERNEFCHCLQGIDYPECGCKGIFCAHKASRSMLEDRRNLFSILRKEAYGPIEYIKQLFHGLQKTSSYSNSHELEISHQAREIMIAAVEKSQIQHSGRRDIYVPLTFFVNPVGAATPWGKSNTGHTWAGGVDVYGVVFSKGSWPRGLEFNEMNKSLCEQTVSFTVWVSPEKQTNALKNMHRENWTLWDNCVDHVLDALDAIEYPHPSKWRFKLPSTGISSAQYFYEWVKEERGHVDPHFLPSNTENMYPSDYFDRPVIVGN